ncbi:type II secretion system F family protein [Kitasatospora sp. NPDC059088]|uniref:type II secretion system F family protein n=1 Tax=Kitasatospora sp. NPDC059088 TaxID=3346722 RepID=UPI0036A4005C
MNLTWTLLAGAGMGFGLFLLVRALFPSRPSAASIVLRIDAQARLGLGSALPEPEPASDRAAKAARLRELIGLRAADLCARQGWELPALRADLSILERSFESFLATKIMVGLFGLLFGPVVFALLWIVGFTANPLMPLWLALVFGLLFFFLPDIEVRGDAKERRAEFLHTLSSFTSLVANNLAGGRGLPEALKTATEITDTPPMLRLRQALAGARLAGRTHWQALEHLGKEIAVPELQDLATRIALAADDGARIRQSLMATAKTLAERELAETEGKAGAQSQTMLVAQIVLCLGFLVFLIYPALMRVMAL